MYKSHNHTHGKKGYGDYVTGGAGLFWFVAMVLIIYLLLVFFKPDWVQRSDDCEKNGEVDQAVAIGYAVGLAILICFVLALLAYAFYCY